VTPLLLNLTQNVLFSKSFNIFFLGVWINNIEVKSPDINNIYSRWTIDMKGVWQNLVGASISKNIPNSDTEMWSEPAHM